MQRNAVTECRLTSIKQHINTKIERSIVGALIIASRNDLDSDPSGILSSLWIAILLICLSAKTVVPFIGIRRLSECAGLPRESVHRSRIELENRGFISKGRTNPNSHQYRVNLFQSFGQGSYRDIPDEDISFPALLLLLSKVGHDAFRNGRQSPGKIGFFVCLAIYSAGPQGLGRNDLAGWFCKSSRCINDRLRRLLHLGIVRVSANRYRFNLSCDLDAVAKNIGKAGMGERAAKRHSDERIANWRKLSLQSKQPLHPLVDLEEQGPDTEQWVLEEFAMLDQESKSQVGRPI